MRPVPGPMPRVAVERVWAASCGLCEHGLTEYMTYGEVRAGTHPAAGFWPVLLVTPAHWAACPTLAQIVYLCIRVSSSRSLCCLRLTRVLTRVTLTPTPCLLHQFLRALAVLSSQLRAELFVPVAALGLALELPDMRPLPSTFSFNQVSRASKAFGWGILR